MNLPPLVSCIMPTANREQFIPLAISNFLRQDYINSELIVVDDGIKPVQSLIPQNDRIKYYRPGNLQNTIGAKRNMACEMAKGEIIMHWDDDDWYAPNWISYQMYVLYYTKADICGLRKLYFHNPLHNITWKYIYPANEQPWVGGATMAYHKSLWKRNPFKNIQVGEDNQFVWFSHSRVIAHDYLNGFISMLHRRNTSPKYTTNERWERQDHSFLHNDIKTVVEIYKKHLSLFE